MFVVPDFTILPSVMFPPADVSFGHLCPRFHADFNHLSVIAHGRKRETRNADTRSYKESELRRGESG